MKILWFKFKCTFLAIYPLEKLNPLYCHILKENRREMSPVKTQMFTTHGPEGYFHQISNGM